MRQRTLCIPVVLLIVVAVVTIVLRRRRVPEAARGEPLAGPFSTLRHARYVRLITFRRNGEPVATPVWFALNAAEDRLYVTTARASGKVRRIRATPAVLLAPCRPTGTPTGPEIAGQARVLSPEEQPFAEQLLLARYGWQLRAFQRIWRAQHVEHTLLEIAPG